jgi:hypothetical protein
MKQSSSALSISRDHSTVLTAKIVFLTVVIVSITKRARNHR